MLHACLMLWGLKITDLAGWLRPIAAGRQPFTFDILGKLDVQVLTIARCRARRFMTCVEGPLAILLQLYSCTAVEELKQAHILGRGMAAVHA